MNLQGIESAVDQAVGAFQENFHREPDGDASGDPAGRNFVFLTAHRGRFETLAAR